MAEVIMPKMGDAMTEGKVLRWMKHPGDTVAAGEALAEIVTRGEEGAGAGPPSATERHSASGAPAPAPSTAKPPEPGAAPTPERIPPEERIKASPLARRLARERGVEPAELY